MKAEFDKECRQLERNEVRRWMEDEWRQSEEGKDSVMRCKLIPIQPTQAQARVLRMWLEDTRKTYNIALQMIHQRKLQLASEIVKMDGKAFGKLEGELVKACVSADGLVRSQHRYILLRTPKCMRQQAVKSLIASLKQFKTNQMKRLKLRAKYPLSRKLQNDWTLQLSFKSVHDMKQDSMSIESTFFRYVDASHFSLFPGINPLTYLLRKNVLQHHQPKSWDRRTFHKRPRKNAPYLMKSIRVQSQELSPKMLAHDMKVHFKLGKWYLIVPTRIQVDDPDFRRHQQDPDEMCAIDPGIRKFTTVYSPQGEAVVLGGNVSKVLGKCFRRIDKWRRIRNRFVQEYKDAISVLGDFDGPVQYKQTWHSTRGALYRKFRKRIHKVSRKYHAAEAKAVNKIKDLHYKVAHVLCSRYKTIFYPTFNAHEIAQSRKLRKIVKRRLNMLSFYKFSERLKQVSTRYGASILRGDERYTSKQCGNCGFIHDDLGSDEVFTCPRCHVHADRDVHAARNILLKHLNNN